MNIFSRKSFQGLLSNFQYKFSRTKHLEGKPKLVFVFSPRGSQWNGMGRLLYKENLFFRESIRECDKIIQKMLGWSLEEKYQLDPASDEFKALSLEEHLEPEIVALQISLIELWRYKGIKPDAVVGLSGGEFTAAYMAGALDLWDTMKLACAVSLAIRKRLGLGKMVLVLLDKNQIETLCQDLKHPVYITAAYSKQVSIVAGSEVGIEELITLLQYKGAMYQLIPTEFAFHSPIVNSWKEQFTQSLQDIFPMSPSIPVYSSFSKGKCNAEFNANHWWEVVREPAYFKDAIKSLVEDGYEIFLEISPHQMLADPICEAASDFQKNVVLLPSMIRNEDETRTMKTTLQKLYSLGFQPKLKVRTIEKDDKRNAWDNISRPAAVLDNAEPGIMKFDLFSEKTRVNPYPFYKELRQNARIYNFWEQGFWAVGRYVDVNHILKSPQLFSSVTMSKFDPSLLGADPPDHTRVRRIVSQLFSQQKLIGLKNYIRECSVGMVNDLVKKQEFDVIDELAAPLPLLVIMKILGVDPSRKDDFARWSNSVVEMATGIVSQDHIPLIKKDKEECIAFLEEHIQECLNNPNDSLFSELINKKGEEKLTFDEAINFSQLLLIAGNETTTNLIGNSCLALLNHPHEINNIRNNIEMIPALIEEVLRFDSPVQFVQRLVKKEIEIFGTRLPQGARVIAVIGSANRDPEKFSNPDQFISTRNPKDHIAFGSGIHFFLVPVEAGSKQLRINFISKVSPVR